MSSSLIDPVSKLSKNPSKLVSINITNTYKDKTKYV